MNRHLLSATLLLAGLASGSSLFAQSAPVPPVPAPTPVPGLTNDPFNQVVLSPVPAPGASVPGWYPLELMLWNGMEEVLEDRSPDVFAADQGVLRFRDEYDGYPSGRVRQLPDGTSEVCVDLYFYEGSADYAGYGMTAGFDDYGYPIYGATVSSHYIMQLPAAPEGGVEEGELERVYVVSGPGFYEEIEADLSGQWLRLCMKLDATRTVFTVELNGEVVYSGPLKGRRSGSSKIIDEPSEPLPFFTDVALVAGYGGAASEPEAPAAVEESQIPIEVFFDNFSHNGASGAADLTVGPTRATAGRTGDGVFGRDASRQSILVNAKYNAKALAFFGLGNEGGSAGNFVLRGSVAGASKVGVVSSLYQGGKKSNVTAGLRAGTAAVSLSGGESVVIASGASLKPAARTLMSRLRGRFLQGRQSLSVSAGDGVVDAAGATYRFESAIPATRRQR